MKKVPYINYVSRTGFSTVEAMLAVAIFAMIATAFTSALIYGPQGTVDAGDRNRANYLIDEGFSAISVIRDDAWNELTYSQSGVDSSTNQWNLLGEGTNEVIGKYTRTISFSDVCRDGSNAIVDCPGTYSDLHSKFVTITIEWMGRYGNTKTISDSRIYTNWQGIDWIQTDWAGGDTQSIWSDETMYESDDGNIDISATGQVSLNAATGCGAQSYSFDTDIDYTYDSSLIELSGSQAQLLSSDSSSTAIQDSAIGSYEYDSSNGQYSSIINISGDYYAIAYIGPGNIGTVQTVTISSAGVIGSTINTLAFGSGSELYPDIIHVTGNVYAITYTGSGNDGFVSTVEIDSTGNITSSLLDTLEFDSSNGVTPNIIQVDTDTYAIAYTGSGNDGWLATVDIDSFGIISSSTTDTLEFDNSNGQSPSIIQVDADTYAIAYTGPGTDGWITTLAIDATGIISSSTTDSFEFDASNAVRPRLVHSTGDVFFIAYSGPGSDGWLVTLGIDVSGNIGASVIDSLEYNTTNGWENSILAISSDRLLISSRGDSNDGFVYLIDVDGSGGIGGVLDTLEYDTADGMFPDLVSLSEYYYAIAYTSTGNDGFIASIELTMSGFPTNSPTIQPVTAYTPSTIDAWYGFVETATTNTNSSLRYQLSDDDGTTWRYWNGSAWTMVSAATDYNTATEINDNLPTFDVTASSLLWKAFLISDGVDQVQLDEIQVDCVLQKSYSFDTDIDYTYDTAAIEITGNQAQFADQGTPIDSNTMALWHLDESSGSFIDATTNVNTLTVTGAPTYGTTGEFNTAVTFGNSTHYGSITDAAQYGLDIIGSITLEAWVNKTAYSGTDTLISKWTTGANQSYLLQVSNTGQVIFRLKKNPATTTLTTVPGVITPGTWQHVAAVYDGATMYVFVDGVLTGSTAYVGGIGNGSAPLTLSATGTTAFNGSIDEVRISNIARWTSAFTVPTESYGLYYATDAPTIQPVTAYTPSTIDAWYGFVEMATTNTNSSLRYQLSDDDGTTWRYWNGSAWTMVSAATDYNTATEINDNLPTFDVTASSLLWKAFLISDGVDQVQLDDVLIQYQEPILTSGGSSITAGEFTSSSFDISQPASVAVIEWDETIPVCTPDCTIQLQVRTAPDLSGAPDTDNWTDWHGETGSGTFFTNAGGTLISTDLNGNQWVQYRVELSGDGSNTPILEEVRINYHY